MHQQQTFISSTQQENSSLQEANPSITKIDARFDSKVREQTILQSLQKKIAAANLKTEPNISFETIVPASTAAELAKQIKQVDKDLKFATDVLDELKSDRQFAQGKVGIYPFLTFTWAISMFMNFSGGRVVGAACNLLCAAIYGTLWASASPGFQRFFADLFSAPRAQANRLLEKVKDPDLSKVESLKLKREIIANQCVRVESLQKVKNGLSASYEDLVEREQNVKSQNVLNKTRRDIHAEIQIAQLQNPRALLGELTSNHYDRSELVEVLGLIELHYDDLVAGREVAQPSNAGAARLLKVVQNSMQSSLNREGVLIDEINTLQASLELH